MRDWLIEHAYPLALLVPIGTLWLCGTILTNWRKDRNLRLVQRGFEVTPKRG
jgi:hypothetical protein